MSLDSNPHALALLAVLGTVDGLDVGDGVAPDDHTGRYVVLHMLPGGEIDGTAADPDEWADARFQITAVGRVASEARWVADLAHEALVTETVAVDGRSIQRVRPLDAWARVERDDDQAPPLFYATRVYGLWSFPGDEITSA